MFALVDHFADVAQEYFNASPAARKTLFGVGRHSLAEIHDHIDRLAARMYHDLLEDDWTEASYHQEDPSRILALIQHTLIADSIRLHVGITAFFAQEMKRAARAYLAAHFPPQS